MEQLVAPFEARSPKAHELEISEGEVEALGVTLDAGGLLRRRLVTGQAAEIIVGHCTFAGLIRRESLSIFSA
eukprot:8787822-Pyramimonas_sp.AAC.1